MESIKVSQTTKARYVGPFEGSRWYRTLWDDIELMGYRVRETAYKEKNTQDGKEVYIWWECMKPAAPGESYSQFFITVAVVLLAFKSIKVQKDGKEIKMDYGDMEMNFAASLNLDYKDKWTKGISRYLRWIYDRFLYKSKIEFYKTKLYEELYTIQNEAKAYFNLVKFM
jgi:hypothetical protein